MRGTHTAGVRSEHRTSSEASKAKSTWAWEEVSAANREAPTGCGGRAVPPGQAALSRNRMPTCPALSGVDPRELSCRWQGEGPKAHPGTGQAGPGKAVAASCYMAKTEPRI